MIVTIRSFLVMAFVVAGCHEATAPAAVVPVPPLTPQNSAAGMPTGWGALPGQPSSFTVGVESAAAHGGTHAAFLTNASSLVPDTAYATISQLVRADSYAGHRVRWSGWVRPTEVELPLAGPVTARGPVRVSGLFLRVDGNDSMLAFDNMQRDPVVGTSDWRQVSVVLDVPATAVGLAFGVIFSGTGQLLADDLALDIVDASVPTTNFLDDPLPSPNVGAAYQNAASVPTNLGFEAGIQSSASVLRAAAPLLPGVNSPLPGRVAVP